MREFVIQQVAAREVLEQHACLYQHPYHFSLFPGLSLQECLRGQPEGDVQSEDDAWPQSEHGAERPSVVEEWRRGPLSERERRRCQMEREVSPNVLWTS